MAAQEQRVILCEKESEAGGILKSEQALPFKHELYELSGTYLRLAEIEKYAEVYTGYRGLEVTKEGILCEDPSGNRVTVPGSTVICALGQRSCTDTMEKHMDTAPYVRVIGDASRVSTITNAVYWGYHAALDI